MGVSVRVARRSASRLSIVSTVRTVRGCCRAVVAAILISSNSCAVRCDSAEFGVFGWGLGCVLLASESEALLLAIALGVVVRRAWAVALLLLVVAHQHDLHHGGTDEEQSGDDGDGEGSGIESAG